MTNHFIDNHIQPLDLSQENANLRDLLNKSMTENAALLQQVTEQQAALNVENEKLARMIDSSAQSRLANMTEAYQEANKRADELDATLDKVQNSWLDAKLRIDELTTALINIGEALFKNYILAFAVRDVAPSMGELEQACEIINKSLSAHGGETIALRQQLADAQASHHSAMCSAR